MEWFWISWATEPAAYSEIDHIKHHDADCRCLCVSKAEHV